MPADTAFRSFFRIPVCIYQPEANGDIWVTWPENMSKDWERIYCHPVYYLETFVDTELFSGTCYKASNWQYLGETTGRGKHERRHIKTRSIKAVWRYPLVENLRTLMTRLPNEII